MRIAFILCLLFASPTHISAKRYLAPPGITENFSRKFDSVAFLKFSKYTIPKEGYYVLDALSDFMLLESVWNGGMPNVSFHKKEIMDAALEGRVNEISKLIGVFARVLAAETSYIMPKDHIVEFLTKKITEQAFELKRNGEEQKAALLISSAFVLNSTSKFIVPVSDEFGVMPGQLARYVQVDIEELFYLYALKYSEPVIKPFESLYETSL